MSAEKRAIQYVVASHRGALRECYWNEAARTPGLTGEILVRWHIDPGGSITESSIRRSSLSNANVEGCILREVNSWSFPATGQAADVNYPFRFGVGSSPARTP